jgi:hypothetical protein
MVSPLVCQSCGANPMLYPCFEQGCPFDAPLEWRDCPECGGEGGWEQHCRTYEHGCGFAHDDSEWRECNICNGVGGMLCEAEGHQCHSE